MARKGMRKRRRWPWVLAAILVLGGAAVAIAVRNQRAAKLPQVKVEPVQRVDLVRKVGANGTIEAKRKVDLSADVMGQIVNLAVREGETVAAGDFLLQIDQAQLEASARSAEEGMQALRHDLDASRAAEREARSTFERVEQSYEDEIVPLSELDRARAALDSARANVAAIERRIAQARAQLAGARDTLSKTKIVAPMSGIVTRLPVEEGEIAVIGTMNNPGTVLMTISDLSVVEAVMRVDETDVPTVRAGQEAVITVDAYADREFAGTVTEVGSSPIAPTAGGGEAVDFEVKIQLHDPPEGIRPGFSASAEIITGTQTDCLAIPLQALVVRDKPDEAGADERQEEEGVYRFEDGSGTVIFAALELGIAGETRIQVVAGLEEGDRIVTGPFRALREIEDGDRVRLEEEDEERPGGRRGS